MNAVTSIEQAQKIHYAEVRRRLFSSGKKKDAQSAPVAPVVAIEPPKPVAKNVVYINPIPRRVESRPVRRPLNMWEQHPTSFNHHVILYRRHMLMLDMEANGEGALKIEMEDRREIIDIVLDVLQDFPSVTVSDLKGHHRKRSIVRPRQIAMYEVYMQRPDISFPRLGRWFGGRDHTTVLHAVKKIASERSNELSGEAR